MLKYKLFETVHSCNVRWFESQANGWKESKLLIMSSIDKHPPSPSLKAYDVLLWSTWNKHELNVKSFVCTFVTTRPFSRRNNLVCRRCTNELGWITIVDYDDFMGKFARSGKIQPRSCRYSIYVACILQLMMILKSCIWLYIFCFAFCFTGTVFLLI